MTPNQRIQDIEKLIEALKATSIRGASVKRQIEQTIVYLGFEINAIKSEIEEV
jgi:hypothetical protein